MSALPSTMKAVVIKGDGSLCIDNEMQRPTPSSNEILVRVKAAGVNRLDILQRQGKYPVPAGESSILGVEVAGLVVEIGEEAAKKCDLAIGDRVFALVGGGGYAEFCTIPFEMAMRIPDFLSFVEAASIPEAFLTAYSALYWSAKMSEKTASLLIHAGASGVGMAATQLAALNAPAGRKIIVTAGSPEKLELCQKLGATHGINYKSGPFSEVVYGITESKGVEIVLDFVGGPYFQQNVDCSAVDGHIVLLAMLGGTQIDAPLGFNLGLLLRKRLNIVGTTLRNRSLDYKVRLTKQFATFALELFDKDILKPNIFTTLTFGEVEKAHRIIINNENAGKVILVWQHKALTPAGSLQNLS